MILSIRVNNYLVYSNEVELSLKADMRIKKFNSNVFTENNFNILKTICIYGPNNSGKTCIIRAIRSIKNVLLGISAEVPANIFTNNKTCCFGITFFYNGKVFDYDFKYDSSSINNSRRGFIYESLKEVLVDQYNNISKKEIFTRDFEKGIYNFADNKDLSQVLEIVSNDNILIYSINTSKYPIIEEYKNMFRQFAEKIDIIDMNNIPIDKTIQVLKNNEKIKEKTIELIKLADLDIDDYKYYNSKTPDELSSNGSAGSPNEFVLKYIISPDDMYRLTSIHRGKAVQSISFDSTGTKKIVAAASYIIDALYNGKTLVVDELDSSIHFKLTRAIVSLFNNELNKNAQLIFTAHDVTLLDCKKLFRKDQIWFASKNKNEEFLYSLNDFNSQEDKVRSECNLIEKYNSGILGSLPDPDLISLLINSNNGDNYE